MEEAKMGALLVYTPEKIAGVALCRLLKLRHVNAVYYETPEKALEQIRFGVVDIIILDFPSTSMKIQDMEDILTFAEEIPVILLTPYSMDDKEVQHFQNRGYHIIEKPVCMDSLVDTLYKLTHPTQK
jgi:DNA-binding NtrC family response regulator